MVGKYVWCHDDVCGFQALGNVLIFWQYEPKFVECFLKIFIFVSISFVL